MTIERSLNYVTAAAAIAAVAIMGWREFRPAQPQLVPSRVTASVLEGDQLDRLRKLSQTTSSTGTAMTLVVFTDVQCPFCAALGTAVDSMRSNGEREVGYGVIHYPLKQHQFAHLGARALECSRDQGRLHELLALLYRRQSDIEKTEMMSFAAEAGVLDAARFRDCIASAQKDSIIEAGRALGSDLGLQGTPMVVIDEFVLSQPPRPEQLRKILEARRSGEDLTSALSAGGYRVVRK